MAQPIGWRVLSQHWTERYMPNGQFEKVNEVTLIADDGTTNMFVVPEAKFSTDYVIAMGNNWIEGHNAVASIGNM